MTNIGPTRKPRPTDKEFVMRISKEELLAALLAGPYSHFKTVGADDWRDPKEKNAGFSLSLKGFYDHRLDESGSLYELAKRHNPGIFNDHRSTDKNNLAQVVWDKSRRVDKSDPEVHRLVTTYLTGVRKIPLESYEDLLMSRLIRFNEFKEDRMLVYPTLTPQNYRDAVTGKKVSVNRIQRIFLNSDGSKHTKGKKHLGSENSESCGFVIPPLNGNLESTNVQVFEGLEDSLSIRDRFEDHWFLVATDKDGLKKVTEFFGESGFTTARIIADHDVNDIPQNTGQAAAWRLGEKLRAQGVEVVVRMPPDSKDDANTALQGHRLDEWLGSLIEISIDFRTSTADPELAERQLAQLQESGDEGADNSTEEESGKQSAAKQVVALISRTCELFTDTSRTPFARLNGSGKVLRLDSDFFREWVLAQCWALDEFVPGESAVRSALTTAKGLARNLDDERRVFMRIAQADDTHYLDLGDESGRAVKITPGSWEMVDDPPVMFYRTQNMRPLPEPDREGDFGLLWSVVNVPEPLQDLLTVLLCEWLRENTTHPLLELVGEQGSGKSWVSRCLRAVIDPNRVPLRAMPRKVEDAFIVASNSHLFTIENASKLGDDLQDSLCTLSTGGGYAARRLYSDSDESALDLKKPVLLNGISVLVTRADLLDRTVHVNLPRIKNKVVESNLDEQFAGHLPGILGGLLDVFSGALAQLPKINIPSQKLPRLGDFALLGEAVYRKLGRAEGEFLEDFGEMRKSAVLRILDSSPLGELLPEFIEARGNHFTGTHKLLLDSFRQCAPDPKKLPASPKSLADDLRRLAPSLLETGILVEQDAQRRMDGFHVTISKT